MLAKEEDMKTYTIQVPVLKVQGHQYFTVQAESEQAALDEFSESGGVYYSEEIEVTQLGDPVIIEATDA